MSRRDDDGVDDDVCPLCGDDKCPSLRRVRGAPLVEPRTVRGPRGNYEALYLVGAGTYGSVVVAIAPRSDGDDQSPCRLVAVKLFHTVGVAAARGTALTKADVKGAWATSVAAMVLATAMGGPDVGVPSLLGAFCTVDSADGDPTYVIVMTYIPGRSLFAIGMAAPGPSDPAWARRISADLARTVATLHRLGIVHGDVKSANVVVADGRPWLVDFDLSRIYWDAMAPSVRDVARSTIAGLLLPSLPGCALDKRADVDRLLDTMNDMVITSEPPPEMFPVWGRRMPTAADDAPLKRNGDVWAVGVIVYRLVWGHHPASNEAYPSRDDVGAVYLGGWKGPAEEDVGDVRQNAVAAAVAPFLWADPAERSGTADGLVKALESVADTVAPPMFETLLGKKRTRKACDDTPDDAPDDAAAGTPRRSRKRARAGAPVQ
jgi:serine/threonine protein kinase